MTTWGGSERVPEPLVAVVEELIRDGVGVSRAVPGWGRLEIDRPLPFLALYRCSAEPEEPAGEKLVTPMASYLVAPAEEDERPAVEALVERLAAAMVEIFGAFLLLEVGVDPPGSGFRVIAPEGQPGIDGTVETLRRELEGWNELPPGVPPVDVERPEPEEIDDREMLLPPDQDRFVLALRIPPLFRDAGSGTLYPQVLAATRRQASRIVKRALSELVREHTRMPVPHYHTLDRRGVSEAVERIDRMLASVGEELELLLGVTPVNEDEAWEEFSGRGFTGTPTFRYRPLTVDVELFKRRLYALPLEQIEDPTIELLFREKQEELDRMLTLLLDRGTPRFLRGSQQIYGELDGDLVGLADEVLRDVGPAEAAEDAHGVLDAHAFAERARAEIRRYRQLLPTFDPPVEVRGDMYGGVMVSKGRLLVGAGARIAGERVAALLHHEVGTHLLTYGNGRAQPFRQMYLGLAGYEALQEGLAVLAEYLSGGLTPGRLRILAARVVAVGCVTGGADFAETFGRLHRDHGFAAGTAFDIAFRVYRGGGFTKDAIYLEGLSDLLAYLGLGGDILPLFVGKIAETHLPVLEELELRGVLAPMPLVPAFLQEPSALERLQRVQRGMSLPELIHP